MHNIYFNVCGANNGLADHNVADSIVVCSVPVVDLFQGKYSYQLYFDLADRERYHGPCTQMACTT